MLYRYFERDCLRHGLTMPAIVRTATKQQRTYITLADELPRGDRREVLLMAGMQGRDQVPLLLGDDSSVKHIVGSVRVRVQGDKLVGVLGFAQDDEAQAIRERYLAGELTASVVASPITGVEVRKGEQFHGVDGPATVMTSWKLLQVALE
jgi:hypothetical protein